MLYSNGDSNRNIDIYLELLYAPNRTLSGSVPISVHTREYSFYLSTAQTLDVIIKGIIRKMMYNYNMNVLINEMLYWNEELLL